MIWSLALGPDDAEQDPVVYVAGFGVMFLAEGPRTASIQEGLNCFGLCHSGLEGERYFRLVAEQNSRRYRLMRIQHARVRLAISTDMFGVSVTALPM